MASSSSPISIGVSNDLTELSGNREATAPNEGLPSKGLRKFQARRVNRLLIEAIVPESIWRGWKY
jgi:hypothetical protein